LILEHHSYLRWGGDFFPTFECVYGILNNGVELSFSRLRDFTDNLGVVQRVDDVDMACAGRGYPLAVNVVFVNFGESSSLSEGS
jgi:hypothetical protein